ncbi:uncharacterized protein LOC124336481 [Daphnia pulicaria]|uniref:uncharacterized protein LOC124336481 n=1 Tax=Daphnia pulicaria TaxID=35523 RepID=UPI001EEC3A91|nr:uncharacterized protein LOC124336481 [Daphnia pulicaria]XP_046646267.1 uncharacterized protein LOC124336481 [Daphnia pulicaria]XP_046646268.1 uncharacterized protein LOC124336481 [Daphnia pulicaria]XP_046646269.1 uncharacterized protein LOC124336481 [Daphnia pulicaria]
MEHYSFWIVNTLLVYLTFNYALCNPFDKENLESSNRRSEYDDYSWPNLPSRPFFHPWRNEYRGRKMWNYDRPEPPRSPFHPEELPVGLRTPFLGFRESIFEKVIIPHLRGNSIPSRQKSYRNFDQNALFRHEVEESNFKLPKSYFAESPLASEINFQHEVEEPSEKSYSFDKLFRLGTGNLPLSNSKKTFA